MSMHVVAPLPLTTTRCMLLYHTHTHTTHILTHTGTHAHTHTQKHTRTSPSAQSFPPDSALPAAYSRWPPANKKDKKQQSLELCNSR